MSTTQEIWVDIKNYEGCYQISNKGRVKSLEREVISGGITRTQSERILTHWCGKTSRYDCVRLYKNGIGEKSSNAKLTNAQAERIRERYYAGGVTQLELAIEYGVSHQTVSCIVRHKKYFR